MADSIVRLRVESSEYDAKIKRAAQGLQHMEEACRKVGGTLAVLEKDEKDFVSSLGKMETASKDARGRINELSQAYINLSAQYKRLTDEEKSGDYGKALKISIGDLKTRINDAKGELKDIQGEISGSGNHLDELSGKFGINIKQLVGWGTALSAGRAALGVLKDAFMSSESNADSWGAVIEESKNVYESFVTSLNNSSLDAFFENIQNVINKAKEAYNALDDLQTKGGILNNKQAKLEYERSQQMAIVNDKSATEAQRKAAQKRLKEIDEESRAAARETATLNNNVVKSKIKELLTNNGFVPGTKGFKEAYGRVVKGLYDTSYNMGTVNTGFRRGMRINNGKTVRYTDEGNRNLNNIVTDDWREEVNPYVQAVWSNLRQAEDDTRRTNRFAQKAITSATSSGNSTDTYVPLEGSIDYYKKLATEAGKMITAATTDMARDEAQVLYDEYMAKVKQLQSDIEARASVKGVALTDMAADNAMLTGKIEIPKINLPTNELAELTEELNALQYLRDVQLISDEQLARIDELKVKLQGIKDAMPLTPAEQADKIAKQNAKDWQNAASAIGSVGSALSQIEDPAAKVAGIVAQAIATVAGTFAKSLGGVKMGPWEWIAAAAAGTATMISTIASIKSATEYHAEGGIVGMKGLAKGTDIVPAMLTPGEVVLSAANTSNLADKLTSGNGNGAFTSQPYLQSEMVFLGINNALGRMGKGEIVTTSMLRRWKG